MATAKKRINISIAKQLERAVERLATRDQMPTASKAAELIRIAIEMEEDRVWNSIATARLKSEKRRVSHDDAWR